MVKRCALLVGLLSLILMLLWAGLTTPNTSDYPTMVGISSSHM